ncbi:MAG TPA: helix-turn-helix domain-containing protein [Acidimicrobiia bacterium]|nr:helix-turn-helix domain-containing protein [Acidimicrobiia bacterium]
MAEPISRHGANRTPPPDPERLDARQRARRDRIVQATVTLLPDHPYESLQMKDITSAAGVALGTTYRYFTSKEHLIAEALYVWALGFGREVDNPPAGALERLEVAYRRAARAFELSPCVYGHMVAVQGSNDPTVVRIFDEFASGRMDAFGSYLSDVPSPKRERVISVMNAVLGENLRSWSVGRKTIDDVYASIDSAADLLLG